MMTQRGFTIVELMVSVAISLILLVGVVEIYIDNKQTHKVQSNLSYMQDTVKLAAEFIGTDIRVAGYPHSGFVGTAISGTDNAGMNGSDSLTLSNSALDYDKVSGTYERLDCLGQPSTDPVVNTYFISTDGTGEPSLYCLGSGSATPQPLLDGVENMQVLYGVDTDPSPNGVTGDTTHSANKYVPSNQVPSSEWPNVVSVRVSFTAVSADDNLALQAGPNGDRRLRRTFTTTAALRNRMIK